MSQDRVQDIHVKLAAAEEEQRSRGVSITVVSFYTQLLVLALMMLATSYIFLVVALPMFAVLIRVWGWAWASSLSTWLITFPPKLYAPIAILAAWLLSGLLVCQLLNLWLKDLRTAAFVSLALVVVWGVILARYVRGEPSSIFAYTLQAFGISADAASKISRVFALLLTMSLAIGILVLVRAWFLRSPIWLSMSLFWLLGCFFLAAGLGEYRVGIVLFLSLAASGATFLLGLYFTSGFLLPLPEKNTRGKVLNFLRDWLLGTNFPAYVVVDEPYEEDKIEKRIHGNIYAAADALSALAPIGSGFVLTDCDHAVAISDGINFKGVQGPGVTFTQYADQIVQAIDLRPQLRVFHVEALTKDGIKIRVLAFMPCKIDARGRQPQLGDPLPYNKGAAFKAIHAQRLEHGGSEIKQRKWDELPRIIGERVLQNIISEYNFDDLYGPYQPGGKPPREVIARRFCEQLDQELEPLGIQRVGGGISDLEPADPKVYLERARSWQAEWTRKITLRQAEGQAEWLRTVERARAEAQADLILNLGRQLEELSVARAELRPEEALKLVVSILEGLTSQHPAVGRLLPEETLQALTEIRKAIP